MVDVILHYQGTIDEFIGDAVLVIFGAPIQREDDTERAVGCAIAMQLAMDGVNAQNRQDGLPEVEMGIGVHTGEVVVGNIGSDKRAKYGVVGSAVNLTSRIESYTVGGQILISAYVQQEIGQLLDTENLREVEAKGIERPIALYEVRGIRGPYQLVLPERKDSLFPLPNEIPVRYSVVNKKHLDGKILDGYLVKLSGTGGELCTEQPLSSLVDIKMRIIDGDGTTVPGDVYAKVTSQSPENQNRIFVYFTAVPPDVRTFLQRVLSDLNIPS